ncbi:MAG: nucleotide exchange factor GrpE [Phocaeicola sp.]|nr:nucleotide exchange factor GrpE [Phocaeicola sp.]
MKEKEEKKQEEVNVEENVNEVETPQNEQPQEEQAAESDSTAPSDEPTHEEKLMEQLAQANQTIEEQSDKYLRLSAEFDNYRKRTNKEKAELILNGSQTTIKAILPVLDDMERAMSNMEKSDELRPALEGVELIYNKFIKILEQQGVKKIETENQEFNTDYCEAIAMIPAPSEEMKGKIMDCVQTGYMLNDKVIRHAKVAVGQ